MVAEIVEVLAEIAKGLNNKLTHDELTDLLFQKKNFKKNTIAAAYSWVYEKVGLENIKPDGFRKNSKNFRILSADEVSQIGLNNYNYLLHFYNHGLLTDGELDIIIEQLKLFGDEIVSEEKLKLLILSQFLEMDDYTNPGSRQILYSSDTIN